MFVTCMLIWTLNSRLAQSDLRGALSADQPLLYYFTDKLTVYLSGQTEEAQGNLELHCRYIKVAG